MMRGGSRKLVRGTAVAVALAFLLGTSLHLGLHGHCAGHDPGGGAPERDEGGCLACQVLHGGIAQAAPALVPSPALEAVVVRAEPVRAGRAPELRLALPRGPPV